MNCIMDTTLLESEDMLQNVFLLPNKRKTPNIKYTLIVWY